MTNGVMAGPSTTHFYPNAEFQFVGSNEGEEWRSQQQQQQQQQQPQHDGVVSNKAPVRRNTELIEDRKARLISYHRRRPFPFRKVNSIQPFNLYCLTLHTVQNLDS